ncbi:DNA-directed RNA polymerase specialized sigma subunit, sigma24 family [Hymenobacter gelipurpurascens]|uniref:DNA-directed RNA polymerase specialized sigma subunit, sigma24 family n=1 Tax=Hymenobacter gelipurpurascens TaxID=89968 RepID=A0A212UE66_9BACT|nr:sigma-70 family RNA polymerase sigma factor [Hymenobacter gelipurpurascens]SNC76537.1 DNA-directed RNA polymerase specialized sigma subunit, sigma24 family [Hymenobacter gelipurpurascens]
MTSSVSLLPAPLAAASLAEELRADRTGTLTRLYHRTFPMVRRHVLERGGTTQDAKDVFQDALIVFYEKTVSGQLVLTCSASTYLVGVSRNLWQQELSRRNRLPLSELNEAHAQLPDAADTPSAAPALAVLEYVAQLGEKCQRLLLSFYYFQQPLEQIAAENNYGTVRSATVQKFKCLERLRKAVRQAVAFPAAS